MKTPPPSRINAAMPVSATATLEALLDVILEEDNAGAEDAGTDDATTLAADEAGAELATTGADEPPPPPQAERVIVSETIALATNNGFVLDNSFMISLAL
jgi:hypothetical protein